jgi:hypothetical protein
VGSEALVNYLAAYVSGTAISDRRMMSLDAEHVEFTIKDYKHKRVGSERLSGEEFVKRFALHVLPRYMTRIRYAGLFRAQGLPERLAVCREALGEYQQNQEDKEQLPPQQPPAPDPWREDEEEELEPVDSAGMKCACGRPLEQPEVRIDPAPTMRMISFVEQLVSSTLPVMLAGIITRMLEDLRQPAYNKRMRQRLGVDWLAIDVLSVLLSEALPVVAEPEEPDVREQTQEHFSGIPPPLSGTHSAVTFTRGEAELRNPAFPRRPWEREG